MSLSCRDEAFWKWFCCTSLAWLFIEPTGADSFNMCGSTTIVVVWCMALMPTIWFVISYLSIEDWFRRSSWLPSVKFASDWSACRSQSLVLSPARFCMAPMPSPRGYPPCSEEHYPCISPFCRSAILRNAAALVSSYSCEDMGDKFQFSWLTFLLYGLVSTLTILQKCC